MSEKELWNSFNKLRGLSFTGWGGLEEFFRNEKTRFEPGTMGLWSRFLAERLGRSGGSLQVPDWLLEVFSSLGADVTPKAICDPWAGVGFLLEGVRQACKPNEAIAITQYDQEFSLGRLLAPQLIWHNGGPMEIFARLNRHFDLIASILPMGARTAEPLIVSTTNGSTVELHNDLGNHILVAASLTLQPSGLGLFIVTSSFFFSQRSVFKSFPSIGLSAQAALALPSGTLAPYTNIPTYLLIVRRQSAQSMFVAQLSSDEKTNARILDNLRARQPGGTVNLGRFVDPDTFRSIEAIRVTERFEQAGQCFGAAAVTLPPTITC